MRAPSEPLIRLGSAGTPSQNSAVSAERRVCPWLQEVNKWTSCRGSRRLMTLYVTKCNKAELQGEQKLGKPLDLEDWRHEKGVKAWAQFNHKRAALMFLFYQTEDTGRQLSVNCIMFSC